MHISFGAAVPPPARIPGPPPPPPDAAFDGGIAVEIDGVDEEEISLVPLEDAFSDEPPEPTSVKKVVRPFSDEETRLLESLEQLARGQQPSVDSEKLRPSQMVSSLIRLLIKKGVINDLEFLDELARK